jgi:alpha-glucosidase
VAGSTLTMYRDALALRRKVLSATDALAWRETPAADVLAFDRGEEFRCTVNMGTAAVRLDAPGELLIASGPVTIENGVATIPSDTAVWWSL